MSGGGGCLSRANYLCKDIIYLESLRWKLDGVTVTLWTGCLPWKVSSARVPSYNFPQDEGPRGPDGQCHSWEPLLSLMSLPSSTVFSLSRSRSSCLFSSYLDAKFEEQLYAKIGICASISVLNTRTDLKVFWDKSVLFFFEKKETPRLLITQLRFLWGSPVQWPVSFRQTEDFVGTRCALLFFHCKCSTHTEWIPQNSPLWNGVIVSRSPCFPSLKVLSSVYMGDTCK